MRLLVFDPFHGAAGDMICAALISAGAPEEPVLKTMASVVQIPKTEIVSRCGISALKIHTMAGPACRTFDEVLEKVHTAKAPSFVIEQAIRIFHRIAEAEETVHGVMTHFHEVGADDAIADVIGSCMALSLLKSDRILTLPVATGKGTVRCGHGVMPVPAPATAAILTRGILIVMAGDCKGEQLTPTGAAILSEITDEATNNLPLGRIISIGYGAGNRDDPISPNVLRVHVMECQGLNQDTVDIIETNVDDVSGEIIGSALKRLVDAGARDASSISIIMKKGRPGQLIRVISPVTETTRLAEIMALELGSLGIRVIPSVHRFIAERFVKEISVTINGASHMFPVKFGFTGGNCYLIKPEFDNIEHFAIERGIPVREIQSIVEQQARRLMESGDIS